MNNLSSFGVQELNAEKALEVAGGAIVESYPKNIPYTPQLG